MQYSTPTCPTCTINVNSSARPHPPCSFRSESTEGFNFCDWVRLAQAVISKHTCPKTGIKVCSIITSSGYVSYGLDHAIHA